MLKTLYIKVYFVIDLVTVLSKSITKSNLKEGVSWLTGGVDNLKVSKIGIL